MTTAESNLETKLTQLEINVKKTNVVIESQNSEAIERHLQTLKAISDTVNHLRLEVEVKKIEPKVNSDAIQTWNDDVDSKLQAADVEIGTIRKWLRDREKEAEINAKKETATIRRRNPKDEAATKSGPTSQDEKPKRRSRSRLTFLWCTSKTTKTCDYKIRWFPYGLATILGTIFGEY